jgi:hypothetical protein
MGGLSCSVILPPAAGGQPKWAYVNYSPGAVLFLLTIEKDWRETCLYCFFTGNQAR